jgi:hypothetical protein
MTNERQLFFVLPSWISSIPTLKARCGALRPPNMISLPQSLAKMGYTDDQVITTLEMRMKCGIGKCGRCNIGSKYVCLDGPVFTMEELNNLPNEF